MNDFFDNRRILEIIWSRKIHFVIIGTIAILLAAVFSSPFFITPKFMATARAYPINLGSMSEESHTEQMLEIINSADLKLRLFDTFNLHEVYGIDKDDPLFRTYMFGIFSDHFSVRKTEFETVELSILDPDPARAKMMCDSIISFYNQKVREMHSAKSMEMVKILEDNVNLRRRERDSVVELLTEQRRQFKILDFQEQVPEVTRGYVRALADGRENTAGMREIRQLYDNMIQKGAESFILESELNRLVRTMDSLKVMYDVYLSEANKIITYAHIVEHPQVPDKKAYPVRWLIVAFSLISALFAGLLVFMVLDYKKQN
jgi:LPS O-antigen subunit length determinant protein (WzzB/FepE family)